MVFQDILFLGYQVFFLIVIKVKVAGSYSDYRNVSSGVPQGSVLGPILFLIYVNHIAANITSKYKIFADDIKMYFYYDHKNMLDSVGFCQRDVDTLSSCSKSWGLEMNSSKCAVMRFTPRNSSLQYTGISPYKIETSPILFVSSHTDLGVTIDRSLRFHSHIRRIVGAAGGLTTNVRIAHCLVILIF